MTVIIAIEAQCADCDMQYTWPLRDPSPREIKAHEANRDVWADSHYEVKGHHRFLYTRTEDRHVSRAKVRDPNQTALDFGSAGTVPFGPSTFGETP